MPAHQRIAQRARRRPISTFALGYVMVARSYRTARRRGEIDLIGCDHDVLCCIEVTTRTSHDVKPGRAAVDRDKQPKLAGMGREYLRHRSEVPPARFDVVSVYRDLGSGGSPECSQVPAKTRSTLDGPMIELFKNACPLS